MRKFYKIITRKINTLTNLFNDYKKRNNDLISFYKLLIDNYEQIRNLKNYNLRNNIFLNNNFDFDLSDKLLYEGECLISKYNKLSEFYRNENHIKTQEFVDYYITQKYCNKKIKKAFILNENITCFMFEKENYLCFIYKNKSNENELILKNHDDFIKNIYPLNDNKIFILDEKNKLIIWKITIDNLLNCTTILSFKDIQFVIRDMFNQENFFTISNMDKSEFFTLKYYINDGNKNDKKIYEKSIENKDNMHLIIKENKKINNGLFEYITKIIKESNINQQEKNNLNLIFNNENDNIIQKLIDSNNKFLNFIDTMNINIYNKFKEKISIKENEYKINSNYIMRFLTNMNENNLNQNEINEANNVCDINKLCKKIMETYIHILIFNSKINNIYNYKNKFLLFMGEQYLLIPFSLRSKKFLGFESSNLFKNNSDNYNNYEIINIISNKILINNNKKKIINIIKNDDNNNFYLDY